MTTSSALRALLIASIAATSLGTAQTSRLASPRLNTLTGNLLTALPSNSISHLETRGTMIWIGSGKGLARTTDGGRTWESFGSLPQFASPGIFSVALHGDTIWVSTGYSEELDNSSVQTGSGYTYSLDNGITWNSAPQPLDLQSDTTELYGINTVHFLPIVVPEQNVTFDIAVTDSAVWIASWSSGLRHRRFTDTTQAWHRTVLPNQSRNSIAPTDSLGYYLMDPRNDNNFLLFSVYAQTPLTIWAGSAGGVNKSTDGGSSWLKFSFDNQVSHILGNWVIAIAGQNLPAGTRIWTTNWPAESQGEQYGLSYSDDGGRIWKNALVGVKAYAFAFKDSTVYVATESGLFRSGDAGLSWSNSGSIIDHANGNVIASNIFYCVGVVGDTVYAGTPDGLVRTIDNAAHAFGQSWEVLRSYKPVGIPSSTYAYPNPFSSRSEVVRVHYNAGTTGGTITIEMFDFGMNRIRTIMKDVQRTGGEHDEIWDGRDDSGRLVGNGVYFYRVIVDGGDPAWGKIMVIQ
jgi:hypothetical protein